MSERSSKLVISRRAVRLWLVGGRSGGGALEVAFRMDEIYSNPLQGLVGSEG